MRPQMQARTQNEEPRVKVSNRTCFDDGMGGFGSFLHTPAAMRRPQRIHRNSRAQLLVAPATCDAASQAQCVFQARRGERGHDEMCLCGRSVVGAVVVCPCLPARIRRDPGYCPAMGHCVPGN